MVGNVSKIYKKRIDKVIKDFTKSVMPSKKTMVMFILIAIMIGTTSSLRGMSEEWASEVAKALITINGLLIGFAILGITAISKRGYTETMLKETVEQSANEFVTRVEHVLKKPEEYSKEGLIDNFLSSLYYPFLDVIMLRQVFLFSMEYSLVSIGCALCLFGITTEVVGNPLVAFLFSSVYSFSITMFLWGAYFIIHGIRAILEKGTEINVEQQFEIAANIFEGKLEHLEKELKELAKKAQTEKS